MRLINQICGLAVAAAVFAPQQVLAQETTQDDANEGSGFGNIIVTAQRREEQLQDVGISISALTGEQLENLGFEGVRELAQQTPNLSIADLGGTPTVSLVTIRGVSQNDFVDHQESPNAIFQDGAYNSFIGGIGSQMFDLERVEVLRGPQGTLFGRNSTGGLIHLISKRPTSYFEGNAELTYGSFNQLRVEGALSGPLGQDVSGRIAVVYNRHDGFVKNLVGKDLGAADNLNVRLRLLVEPTDRTELLLTASYGRDFRTTGPGYVSLPAVNDLYLDSEALPLGRPPVDRAEYDSYCTIFIGGVLAPGQTNCFGAPDTGDPFTGNYNPSFFERESWGLTLEATHDFGGFSLSSITDYKEIDKAYEEDSDATAVVVGNFFSDQSAHQFSQELRLNGESGPVNWQVGAYFLNISGDYVTGFDSLSIPEAPYSFLAANRNPFTLETTSYAIFGQADIALSDELTLTLGARWTADRKHFEFFPTCINEDPDFDACVLFGFSAPGSVQDIGFNDSNANGANRLNQDALSFRAQLNYQPSDDLLLYAGVTRANKAGGFNASIAANFGASDVPFGQEILTSYEAGLKSDLLDGLARFNASAFYYDYNNYQAASFTPDLANLVFNVNARVYGADAELFVNPTGLTTIILGAGYLDTKASNVPVVGFLLDQELPQSPKWSFNGVLRQEAPLKTGALYAQGEFKYVGSRFANAVNSPATHLTDYLMLNGRIGWKSEDERFGFELFANNITNTRATQLAFDLSLFFGAIQQTNSLPRWFGGKVSYSF